MEKPTKKVICDKCEEVYDVEMDRYMQAKGHTIAIQRQRYPETPLKDWIADEYTSSVFLKVCDKCFSEYYMLRKSFFEGTRKLKYIKSVKDIE